MLPRGASLVAALIVVVPAAVDPDGWSPFVALRWFAVSTLGFAAAGALLLHGRRGLDRSMQRAWAVLALALVLASLTAGVDDLPTAIVGEPARHLGLVTWVLCWMLFAAGQQLSTSTARRCLARSACVATALVGAWCAWELAVGRPVEVATTTERLLGPFGSAAYLGAACCLLVPVSIGLAADVGERRVWRAGAAVASLGGMLAVVGSGSRGAWLALALTGVVAGWARRPTDPRVRRRAVLAAAALVALPLAALAPRLDDLVVRAHGAGSRLDEWQVATRVLLDHPLGVGPEGYRIAIADGIDADYERAYDRDDTLPDRAHSGPLDVALAGGLLGGTAWLVLMGLLARRAWPALVGRDAAQAGGTIGAGLAAGVVAYGIAQLTLFPIGELDPVWWLVAGAVAAGGADERIDAVELNEPVDPGHRASPWPAVPARRMVAVAACVAASLALVAGVLDVAADRLAGRAIDEAGDDAAQAERDIDRAVELRPDDTHRRLLAALLHAQAGTTSGLARALDQARAAADWAPGDPEVRTMEGTLLLDVAATTGDERDTAAALAHWTAMVASDPNRASWQIALGRAAALAGDATTARIAWEAANALDPDDHEAATLLDALERTVTERDP